MNYDRSRDGLADGCCSAISPCSHQQRDPRSICENCQKAFLTSPFQERVQPWMMACFGEMIAGDREERNHRFLEEALELVQSCGCTATEAHKLVNYVYGRDVGEKGQEVGGVMVTLAALCLAQDLNMHIDAETELARIWTKVEQIRAKQAAKPKHSPLPEATAKDVGEAAVETASRAFYDGMIGKPETQWPHHDGWDGKSEKFKAKVRANMALALQAVGSSDDAKRADYAEERMQHWLDEAQRLALLVRTLGGEPEPGADSRQNETIAAELEEIAGKASEAAMGSNTLDGGLALLKRARTYRKLAELMRQPGFGEARRG